MTKTPRAFSSLLVANRGEIAVRIIKSAKDNGFRTVAVYSSADTNAPHVKLADDAVQIGDAPVGESYLCPDKIIAAAKATGAEAVHPGYGFLSENADFAKACEDAGLIFVGPSADSIDLMGDKARAKRHMIKSGVPCVPGYEEEDQSDTTLLAAAKKIGYPLMVKAAAGGGGRGMRLVENADDLPGALSQARSEAENAFGSGTLILEKAIINPRHVEIQVFGDTQGNIIHLFERDCSVQRRHQKIIEEAPCPVMTDDLRQKMGSAAVAAAKSVNYVGAGTVEFLLDDDGNFYFLEMNTRLQVEHPVTELITGLDLVAMQLRIASGLPLDIEQSDIPMHGHAIEVRLYAEEAANDFLPATGTISLWHPASGPGVRVDAGIATGYDVSPFYDPMVAKVMAHGETREIARQRLIKALNETALFGVPNNRDFLIDALGKEAFVSGRATTAFIAQEYGNSISKPTPLSEHYAAAAVLQFQAARKKAQASATAMPDDLLNWTNAAPIATPFQYENEEGPVDVTLTPSGDNTYKADVNGTEICLTVEDTSAPWAKIKIAERHVILLYQILPAGQIAISMHGASFMLTDLTQVIKNKDTAGGDGMVCSAMHGLLLEVCVESGQHVKAGDTLAVVEAMKMQHEIKASSDGTVEAVTGVAGKQIAAGELILQITTPD
ncbi:geranyl-CoA carboxylase subunit alpha [Kordiimonas sediminis]|uniref:Geranyl-CoA carboxylase subunit alpha n=1 Tax=Kordiimonas sediminis TaxID=1735581 RepID=A0A919AXI3_9PROT|nr:acetyl-CoA carboxylase biotin carboxylase subunit [Kordiimonas sediminis]GHF31187.1 geranyl-CoA carboxylase subunit alpha [Kordiimonas sediminis]